MHRRKRDYTKGTPWKDKVGVIKVGNEWIVRGLINGYKTTLSRHKTEQEANEEQKRRLQRLDD